MYKISLSSFSAYLQQLFRFFKKVFLQRGICCAIEWSPKHRDENKRDYCSHVFWHIQGEIESLRPLTVLRNHSQVVSTLEIMRWELPHPKKNRVCSFLTVPISNYWGGKILINKAKESDRPKKKKKCWLIPAIGIDIFRKCFLISSPVWG